MQGRPQQLSPKLLHQGQARGPRRSLCFASPASPDLSSASSRVTLDPLDRTRAETYTRFGRPCDGTCYCLLRLCLLGAAAAADRLLHWPTLATSASWRWHVNPLPRPQRQRPARCDLQRHGTADQARGSVCVRVTPDSFVLHRLTDAPCRRRPLRRRLVYCFGLSKSVQREILGLEA